MNKKAIDQAATEYWSNYFKEYGKQWVRDIPRRIKTAMSRAKDLQVKTAEGALVPLAHDVSENGILSVEAAFSGKLNDQDARVLITAEFNPEGRMTKFEANRIS